MVYPKGSLISILFLLLLSEVKLTQTSKAINFLKTKRITSEVSPQKEISIKDSEGNIKIKVQFYGTEGDFSLENGSYSLDNGEEKKFETSTSENEEISKPDETKSLKINLECIGDKSYKFFSCCASDEESFAHYIISSNSELSFPGCREISDLNLSEISATNIADKTNKIGSNSLSADLKSINNAGLNKVRFGLESFNKMSSVQMIKNIDEDDTIISVKYAEGEGKEITSIDSEKLYSTELSESDIINELKFTNCIEDTKEIDQAIYGKESESGSDICKDSTEGEFLYSHTSLGKKCDEAYIYNYVIKRYKKVEILDPDKLNEILEEIEDDPEDYVHESKKKKKLGGGLIALIAVLCAAIFGTGTFSCVWFKVLKKNCCCGGGSESGNNGEGDGNGGNQNGAAGDNTEKEESENNDKVHKRSIKNGGSV